MALSTWLSLWDHLRVDCGREGLFVDAVSPSYKGYRYPAEVIAHCVWLYHRFRLSYRDVEELMLARGVVVSHETVRQWCGKFGPEYAASLRRRKAQAGDKWHLDEVFIKVNGERQYLWRAVDQDGNVLDILVQSRRNTKAARRFFRKLLKRQCRAPRVLVTDKLRSYGAAHRQVMPSVEHRQPRHLNNRAENSHQPTRERERAMKGFRSPAGSTALPPGTRSSACPQRPDRGTGTGQAPAHPPHSQTPDKLTTPSGAHRPVRTCVGPPSRRRVTIQVSLAPPPRGLLTMRLLGAATRVSATSARQHAPGSAAVR